MAKIIKYPILTNTDINITDTFLNSQKTLYHKNVCVYFLSTNMSNSNLSNYDDDNVILNGINRIPFHFSISGVKTRQHVQKKNSAIIGAIHS